MSVERSRGEMARRVLRVLLWALLGLVFLRGILTTFSPAQEPLRPQAVTAGQEFPGEEAGAFAVSFARAYLTFSPNRQEWVEVALRPYLAANLPADGGLSVPERGENQVVEQATVARTQRIDSAHALVTVAVSVANRVVTTRYLAVPVARDEQGGLVVYDLPSFSPPPPQASVPELAEENLSGAEARGVEDLLGRFFPIYFGGRTRDLDYFLPPGRHLRSLAGRYAFLELVSVARAPRPQPRGRRRTVLAVVEARDRESSATYVLRYRITLELRERWYVVALNAL